MANTIIMSNNLAVTSDITVSLGAENSQFPVSNIKTDFTTNVSRIGAGIVSGTPDMNSVRIVFQLQEDTPIDTIAVVGSNLDGFGYSNVTVRTSLTTDFGSSTAIPVNLSPEENFGYAFYTETLARYVQLEFLNTAAFVEVSKVFIGKRITLSSTYSIEGFAKEIRRNDQISENTVGNRFVNILNARTYYTGLFPLLERDNFLILENIFLKHGSYEPIWIMLDQENKIFTNGEFKMSIYAYINNSFSHDLVGGGYFNLNLELLETV